MEVREVEDRYISFNRWLWKRLKRWYRKNRGGIATWIKAGPIIILAIAMLGALPLEDTNLVSDVHWQATLVVVGIVTGLIEVAYYALRAIYQWAIGLWRDYQEEIWE